MKTLKHYLKFFLPVVATVALVFASCSSEKEEGALIPKDAYFVADINVNSLWQKGELAKADEQLNSVMLIRSFTKAAAPEFDKLLGDMLKAPSSCGIDMERNISFFMSMNGDKQMAAMTATLKDEEAFENFLSTLTKDANDVKTSEENGRKVVNFANVFTGVYDAHNLVFVFDVENQNDIQGQKAFAAKLFDLDKDNSMAADKNYNEYLKCRKDLNFFASYASLFELKNGEADMEMLFFLPKDDYEALKQAAIYYTLSFEDGSIDFNGGYLGNPIGMTAFMDQKFNDRVLHYMPQTAFIAATFAINPEGFYNYLSQIPFLKGLMAESTELGDVKDIINAFGGSFAFDFYGLEGDKPLFAAACDIKNAALVDQLLASLGVQNGGTIPNSPAMVYHNDEMLVVSTDSRVIDAAKQGGLGNGMADIAAKAKEGNYFYMNLKYQDYPTEVLNAIGFDKLDPSALAFLDLLDYAEAFAESNPLGTFKIRLTDNRNSLATLISTIDNVAVNYFGFSATDELAVDNPSVEALEEIDEIGEWE